ncbi:MAG: aspartate carbamoyltransferase catalytic subunit [Pseudomonadota bacterium]
MKTQYDAGGNLRHLLTLQAMPRSLLDALLARAEQFAPPRSAPLPEYRLLAGATVVNLMCEPSTRTRASFELAARRLGATVLDFDVSNSSQSKGETLLDTVLTLEAMRCDIFVIRTGDAGLLARVASQVDPRVAIVNAGEGNLSHPTQGLLDVMTIRRHHPDISQITVSIVGDVRHSRVARSAVDALQVLGVREIRLCGPEAMLPEGDAFPGCARLTSVKEAIDGAHVVMGLRIQRERMRSEEMPEPEEYFEHYGLTQARLAGAHPQVIVMHPGPVNRGLEMDSALVEDPRSTVREQVANGVAVRMAVLERVWKTLRLDSASVHV